VLTLDAVPIGQFARVVEFQAETRSIRQKLLAMGLIPGVILQVVRVAPLGCPLQIRLRGVTLSLRKKECQQIKVECPVTQDVLSKNCPGR
jgi:ferrous iron transport protein A